MFTQQNTDGYTDAQLEQMNNELQRRLAETGLDPERDRYEYQEAIKNISDQIHREFC